MKHFSHVKCHSSLERTAIEAIVPGRRDKGRHKVVMTLSTTKYMQQGNWWTTRVFSAFCYVSAVLQKVLETKFSRKRCALYFSKYNNCFTNYLICLSIIRKNESCCKKSCEKGFVWHFQKADNNIILIQHSLNTFRSMLCFPVEKESNSGVNN